MERLLWEQDVAGSNPVFPTILKPVDQMIYGFCFLSCSLVVVRKIDGVEAGHAWKDEKHPCCGGAAEPAASYKRRESFVSETTRTERRCKVLVTPVC